ncbi:biopolymer transporter ExbD [bacterium]|nr:biopolymer transporter ExbD [bacterium]
MPRLKRRTGRKVHMPEITLTPLIDTFCVLLVIFMIAAPMVQHAIKIDLPQGKAREGGKEQEFVVTLSKDHSLYFNNFPISHKDLTSTVQKALINNEDTPVYVRADQTVSYGEVIEVVDELKMAGVRYVAMSTKPH